MYCLPKRGYTTEKRLKSKQNPILKVSNNIYLYRIFHFRLKHYIYIILELIKNYKFNYNYTACFRRKFLIFIFLFFIFFFFSTILRSSRLGTGFVSSFPHRQVQRDKNIFNGLLGIRGSYVLLPGHNLSRYSRLTFGLSKIRLISKNSANQICKIRELNLIIVLIYTAIYI